jgi:hypothetical protein
VSYPLFSRHTGRTLVLTVAALCTSFDVHAQSEQLPSPAWSVSHRDGWFGRLGVIDLGDRAAIEEAPITAEDFTITDLSLGYTHPRFELELAIQSLLHFTPGAPLDAQATATLFF